MSAVVPDPATTDWVPLGGTFLAAKVKLAELTPTAGVIDFTAIPGTYSHLEIEAILRDSAAATIVQTGIVINGVVSASYHGEQLLGTAAVASAVENLGFGYGRIGRSAGASTPAGYASYITLKIPFYARNDFRHSFLADSFDYQSNLTGGQARMLRAGWLDVAPAAITRVMITTLVEGGSGLVAPSRAILYGVS